jgi:hypothetical protein
MSKTAEQIGAEFRTEVQIIESLLEANKTRLYEAINRLFAQLDQAGLSDDYVPELSQAIPVIGSMAGNGYESIQESVMHLKDLVCASLGTPDEEGE